MESLCVNRKDLFGCDVSYFIPIIFRVAAVDGPFPGLSWDELLDKILDHSCIGVRVLRTSASETK